MPLAPPKVRFLRKASALGALCRLATATPAAALELTGDIGACHDPSHMIEWNGRYYIFSTAPNLNVRSSADLVSFRWESRAFDFASGHPPWMEAIDAALPASERNLWAPNIIEAPSSGGSRHFLLYYSRNLLHPPHHPEQSERSLLGVATSASVTGPYSDGGAVLNVGLFTDHYRVIDPAPIFDEAGQLWVAVGSFGAPNANGYENGGIRIFRMNPETGQLLSASDEGVRIAGSWMEAPYLYFRGGYYYLFFAEGRCCEGLSSTYFVRMGRASSITGPYTDKDGASLLTPTEGGSLFMGLDFDANHTGTPTNATARPHRGSIGRELGPGHTAIATPADGIERVTYHYYDTANGGEPTLGLKTVVWGTDGWPRPGWAPRDGTYAIGTAENAGTNSPALWLSNEDGAPVLAHYTAGPENLWNIERVGPNRFLVTSAGAPGSLSAGGSQLTLAQENPSDNAQLWFIEQTNDGSFLMRHPGHGECAEVSGAAAQAQAAIHTAPCNAALSRQRWFITPAGAYRIRSDHGGLAASASGTEPGSPVTQALQAEAESQYWWLVPTVTGATKIVHVESSLALGVQADTPSDGAPAVLTEVEEGHHWSFDVLTDGSFRIVPLASGKALGVADAATNAGALLEQRRWLHVRSQQWSLDPVSGLEDRTPPGLPRPGDDGGSAGSGGSGGTAGTGGTPGGAGGGPGTGGTPGADASGGEPNPEGGSQGDSGGAQNDVGASGSPSSGDGCGCKLAAFDRSPSRVPLGVFFATALLRLRRARRAAPRV